MPTTGDQNIRISDADRQAVVDLLRRHTGDGRLTMPEFEERAARALAATTRGDLSGLLSDLPPLPGPSAPSAGWAGARPAAWQATPWGPPAPAPAPRPPSYRWGALAVPPTLAWIALMMIGIWAISGFGHFWPIWVIVPLFFCARRRPSRRRHTIL